MKIESLANSLLHSKISFEDENSELFVAERELTELKALPSTTARKLLILERTNEISVKRQLIDERKEEIESLEAELLEKLKEGNFEVDEVLEFHLHDESYSSIEYNNENKIIVRGPYSKL